MGSMRIIGVQVVGLVPFPFLSHRTTIFPHASDDGSYFTSATTMLVADI